jgi:hypothetical protein
MLFHFGISASLAEPKMEEKREGGGRERGDKDGNGAFGKCYHFARVAAKQL